VDAALAEGLADLDGFSHVVVLYAFDRSEGFSLTVTPYLDDSRRGLFATRALVGFFRNLLSGGQKDNRHLFRGVLTGILRVARESILSDAPRRRPPAAR